ncbi:hypothetical protein [Arthrobacter sp. SO5]|uniref:hypothetical protein n=1 Tax=Arthrobacter sp. SO5 TaxID=1897055 RepID=UPI001E5AB4CB|nr:hypothetical protein [Arthrobacter sp. SO5]
MPELLAAWCAGLFVNGGDGSGARVQGISCPNSDRVDRSLGSLSRAFACSELLGQLRDAPR